VLDGCPWQQSTHVFCHHAAFVNFTFPPPLILIDTLVAAGADGTWQVLAAAGGSSLAGTCSITATITFQGGIAPLTATTAVDLVWLTQLAVYALGPELDAVPPLPPANALVQGDELVLLQCEANRYDQVLVG
jgi:hypothetical protein